MLTNRSPPTSARPPGRGPSFGQVLDLAGGVVPALRGRGDEPADVDGQLARDGDDVDRHPRPFETKRLRSTLTARSMRRGRVADRDLVDRQVVELHERLLPHGTDNLDVPCSSLAPGRQAVHCPLEAGRLRVGQVLPLAVQVLAIEDDAIFLALRVGRMQPVPAPWVVDPGRLTLWTTFRER